jgi:hypothetical protein
MSNDDILKFIKNEKEVSEYKIALLSRGAKAYNKRLVSIEKSFMEFPFEDIEFSDVESARESLSLFKASKKDFFDKFPGFKEYNAEHDFNERVWSAERGADIQSKKKFLEDLYLWILDVKICEVNAVQDNYLFGEMCKKHKRIEVKDLNIEGVRTLEGVLLSKQRARMQAMAYSVGRFVHSELRRISSLYPFISEENHVQAEEAIDSVIYGLEGESFRYFNEGLDEMHYLIDGTMGHNDQIGSVNKLKNLCSGSDAGTFYLERLLPESGDIYNPRTLKPLKKRASARAYALVTPLNRVGNEYINVVSRNIWTGDGVNISSMLDSSFFNAKTKKGKEYFKAISCIPAWKMLDEAENKEDLRDVIYYLFGINNVLSSDRSEMIKKMNNNKGNRVLICQDRSRILIPETRSDSLHLLGASVWMKKIIQKVNSDYFNTNKIITNDISSRVESRKNLIKELFDN